jgi:NADPH:quinone reductase-like Zn-dependent oxidoreductase
VKAVGLRRFGGAEVLEVLDLPEPTAGPGEVRIRVHAAAVNPVDTLIRAGLSQVRLTPGRPVIPGLDVAGVIDQIGPAATTPLRLGDRVMAMVNPTRPAGGGYAEWVVLPASHVVRAPGQTSHAEASSLPMNGLTALRALDALRLRPAETVAVTGAAGAVGGYAVQLAAAFGHRVIADAAPSDAELVAGLGAGVVDRGPGTGLRIRAAAGEAGVDAAVDAAVIGADLVPAVRDGGRLATVRSADDQEVLERLASARVITVTSVFVHDYDGRTESLDLLRQLADAGRLTPRVAAVYPPDQAAEAHRTLERGGVRGRLVIAF